MNQTLEVAFLGVSDVDVSKDFYTRAGFNPDHDSVVHEGLRFVQMTPPGSGCSIAFGEGITEVVPGGAHLMLCADDITAARQHLLDAGFDVSEVDVQPWGHFVYFSDPDGNRWNVQYLPHRHTND
ncbi:VOC family protein [Williamsia sterculiae]|uniref:VOC domain-containing protein n=1 Tax=Williamsia sterculiae TaxID=1344003 RepID=A0A1N7GNV8_9NOCA|nr:VOC family protein [Williamsia sterculiae]SIS14274.1 hypothetical protein SAMN05445060_2938 [Williamsia sterculiae]